MHRCKQIRVFFKSLRAFSSYETSTGLVYESFGNPSVVVNLREMLLRTPQKGDVVVKFLAAPVNPADLNMIEGVYPIKPPFPAVGGNEGVAEVLASESKKFQVGDWVVPNEAGLGTWRTTAVLREDQVYPIPSDISVVSAATLSVNPCTAYRMLHDFVSLDPDDYIVQNGATSGVGQAVIQIAREMGVRTINIIRRNPGYQETANNLKELGADIVVTEEEFDSTMAASLSDIKRPKLALNCVGGKSSLYLVKYLAENSVVVTYGGMSKRPVPVPAGPLIFKNVAYVGFWMTRWTTLNKDNDQRKKMWSYLCKLAQEEKLLPPNHTLVDLDNFKTALSGTNNKCILLTS